MGGRDAKCVALARVRAWEAGTLSVWRLAVTLSVWHLAVCARVGGRDTKRVAFGRVRACGRPGH